MALVCETTNGHDEDPFPLPTTPSTNISLCREISEQYDISVSAIHDIYLATPLQAGLIALSMKQPGAYAVRSELPLSEDVNIHTFKGAWEIVVQQFPILRTRLVQTSLGVMQVVLSESVDWMIEDDLDACFGHEKKRMIGLGDSLAKYAIIGQPPGGHRFVWTVHHALFDAWSMAQIFRHVEAAYGGADLAPAADYKLFINYLSTVDHAAQDSYWHSQLADASPLKYPVLPSSTHQALTNTAVKQTILFSRHLSSVITAATMIRTAWALLLSQYANTDDVVFGATVSGRGAPVERIDMIVGPTIATVPIRIHWNRDQSISSLLSDVQSQATSMIPFEQIGMQNLKRLSSEIQHACDFQTLLVVQTSRSETALQFLGHAAKVEDWQNLSAYALVMEAMLIHEGAYCHVTYDSQVISQDEIQSLIFQFEHIIQQLCLEDSDALVKGTRTSLVLCSSAVAESPVSCVECLIVDRALMKRIPINHSPIITSVSSHNLAYVVHTSGSTGKPKGIMHTHSTYVSGVKNRIPTMYRNHNARVLQFASYSFDVSIEDIWTTLLVGGVVCIPSDHEGSNDLVGYMNRAKTTYAEITPSLARTLQPEALPRIKIIALSGEASTKADRDRWLNNVIVLDEYGPAEIAIKSNLKHVEFRSHPSDKGPNVACLGWITQVENHEKLQAKGAIGELLLEGPIVARGYLHEPEKTDEVFINNPAWLPTKAYGFRRLYKTGDLAVYNPDFSLRILGRKDTQVKLRGQRLELGQIEHQVRQTLMMPALVVADPVSLKAGSKTGTLVIFISFDNAKSGEIDESSRSLANDLYSRLSAALPSYMVPSAIIPMLSLPLNMSGKVDRLKLKQAAPNLDSEKILYFSATEKSSRSFSFTDPEKQLQSLWAEILDIDATTISPEDNFLHCGGDSILAMKMVAAATRMRNGITLTVKNIFLYPKLCDMALVASAYIKVSASTVIEPYQLLGCANSDEIHAVRCKVAALCNVEMNSIRDIYPCSPLQVGLTAISVKNPGYYIAQHFFELPQTVELEQLHKAWAYVNEKSPTLRTRIVQLESKLVQAVVKQKFQWQEGQDLKEFATRDKSSPMLLEDPLVRFAVVEESAKRFLVFSLHHEIYDGWSFPLVLEAVTKTYDGDTTWKPPAEYKYFLNYLSSLDKESHHNYWQKQLIDVAESSSNFPTFPQPDYACKAESTFEHRLKVSFGRLKGFTVPTIIQGAWALLLTKYTESSDLIFGTTVNGRNIPLENVDEMIGPVFTTIPVRMKLNLRSAASVYLSQVQNQVIEMIEYQHFGLQNIARINEDTKVACRFRALIVMQTKEQNSSSQGALGQRRAQDDYSIFNPFAVMVQFIPIGSAEFLINVNYDSKVIDQESMQRFIFQFEFVVEQLCPIGDDTAIGNIPLLSSRDHYEIMKWNSDGKPPDPALSCVHNTIQQQALESPEAVAVHAWDGILSYRALDQISTALAGHLAKFDLEPESIVPICPEKSFWAVVGVLATLKAGAAFTLLDPSHPIDRLNTIIHETKAKLVLASPNCRKLFPERPETVVVLNETIGQRTATYKEEFVASPSPSNLACIVFTSGSTGKPKGILLEHQNLCSSILAHGAVLSVGKHSRVFQFASFAFDMAVYDILTTLAFGGCVCIPSDHDKLNNLAMAVENMRANWAFFTPSTLALLRQKDVPSLQNLVVGGEPVTRGICDEWIGKVRLFQCSGPAKTTTCIAGEMDHTSLTNCLGNCCGTISWIVDPLNHDVLQPVGVVGELVLEGPTVARGYLSRHDEAAGGFIRDTLWSKALRKAQRPNPTRMYKTGDLVRYDSQGRLIFVGRKDTQIKMRGQRLELTEVEGSLRKTLPDAQVAAEVIIPKDGTQQRTLVAFVALRGIQRLQYDYQGLIITERSSSYRDVLENTRRSLSRSLPSYMIPSAIIPLEKIPLSSSGKIERLRLRQIGACLTQKQLSSFSFTQHRNRPPETAIEHRLRNLWAEVLKISENEISIDDDFLGLGGDSLSAMQLVAIARREELDLTVASIFNHPVLADMASTARVSSPAGKPCQPFELLGDHDTAAAIREEVGEELGLSADRIVDIYPCTPLQEGLLALSTQRPGAYIAQEVYKLAPSVDRDRLKNACGQVVAMNPMLRTRIVQLSSSRMMQVVVQE